MGRPPSPLAAGSLGEPHGIDETAPAGDEHHRRLRAQALAGARDVEPRALEAGGSLLMGKLARSCFVGRITSAGSVDAEEAGRTVSPRSTRPYLPSSERM